MPVMSREDSSRSVEPPPIRRSDSGIAGMGAGLVLGLIILLALVWQNVPIVGDDRPIVACVPAIAGMIVGLVWPRRGTGR